MANQNLVLSVPPKNTVEANLLGNGDIGVAVFGGPECVTLQVGKNDIWDRRDGMDEMPDPPKHSEIVARNTLPSEGREEVNKQFDALMHKLWKVYTDPPYHCAKPAGQIRFRMGEHVSGDYLQTLRLWQAEVETMLGDKGTLRTLVPYQRSVIVARYEPKGLESFKIELARHVDTTFTIPGGPKFGVKGRDMWLSYDFPADPTFPNGFRYVMYGRVLGGKVKSEVKTGLPYEVMNYGYPATNFPSGLIKTTEGQAVASVTSDKPVEFVVAVKTTRDAADPFEAARAEVDGCEKKSIAKIKQDHQKNWQQFYKRSFVELENEYLTQHWWLCNYHLRCCSRPGKVAPGLYGNWTWEDVSKWFSDYHWNYNFQQAFWGTYSSNHLEQAIPYNEVVMDLLPAAKEEARSRFGMRGAKFFLTSYPRKTTRNPYPGLWIDYNMSITAWVPQNMWWYYQYSQDKKFLREQAYPVMRESAAFFEDYLTLAPDGKYDIMPTTSPEHWGFTKNFTRNKNCLIDLALIRQLMKGCLEASETLGLDAERRPIWKNILDNLREFPTGKIDAGEVFVDVEGAPFGLPHIRYNLPVPLCGVFPGNEIGLHSDPKTLEIARRTAEHFSYNLQNQYILLAMERTRLGVNELPAFEKNTRFLRQPGGAIIDNVTLPWIWVENFASPIVINESLLQSYTGIVRLNPVGLNQRARFENLRTVGAFLCSGRIGSDGSVEEFRVKSEVGGKFRFYNPWSGPVQVRDSSGTLVKVGVENGVCSFDTKKGASYNLMAR